ncbi:envelope-like protein [Cucumis melo var. makuwa]|uniref:Envelope-like protein n=1 Tax=Cucumis melo var. makuwa TaxID=1194695 RepID=A0A5D3DLB4_CUCMM|nr:envelope-like protein [Cucumis melo var. makuwa]
MFRLFIHLQPLSSSFFVLTDDFLPFVLTKVNTRKGNYQAKLPEVDHEVPASKSTMHGVRIYHVTEHDDVATGSAAKGVENAPSVSETHISDMDLDEQDDVLLARLLKKGVASNVVPTKSVDLVISAHSQKSSSSQDVFVPTLGLYHVSNEKPGPSRRLPPVRTDVLASETSDVENVEPAYTSTTNTVEPDANNDFQPERNFSRTDHWKFVVHQRIAEEVNVLDKNHSYLGVVSLIQKVDLSKTISNVGPFYPKLIREFILNLSYDFNDPSSPDYQIVHIRGTLSSWLVNGSLWLLEYAILHKIGIANWFPSTHASRVSVALGTFLLFHDSHVPDTEHDMRPSRASRIFDINDWDESADGFFVNQESSSRIVNTVTAESRALSTSINLMSE